MRKLTFVIGFGAGYLLGSKAGRARYEQIMRMFRGVKENPTVQETAGVVQAQATGLYSQAKEKVGEKLGQARGGSTESSGPGTTTGTTTSTYPDYSAGSNGVVR